MKEQQPEPQKFDPRQYLAIYIFRWKIIVLCALYCMLAGVIFIEVAPRKYLTNCIVQIWRDPTLRVSQYGGGWRPLSTHAWTLTTSRELEDMTIGALKDKVLRDGRTWRERMGGIQNMKVKVEAAQIPGQEGMLKLGIKNADNEYASAYLNILWTNFVDSIRKNKQETFDDTFGALEDEIKLLEDGIENAENDLVDYARLNQLDLTAAKGSLESRYLMALLSHQNQLDTELMLLEAQFPVLKDEDPTVILDAGSLTREAGGITPVEGSDRAEIDSNRSGDNVLTGWGSAGRTAGDNPEVREWQNKKVRLTELEMREKELKAKFNPDHPELREVQKAMSELRNDIKLSSQVAFGRLMDRRKALRIAKNALEVPVRTWKNTYGLANQKQAAYRRKTLAVERQERTYRDLYSRLYDLKIGEEMKSEHVRMVESVRTEEKPVWPDARAILLASLVLALGSGFGLATLAHIFDNRMQTVSDVETVLGVPFLGGIPHWARRGGDSVVRPIVLEEHASGAIEAYRVLRTGVMDALEKIGRKPVLITSAESREGKTLTALNLAVMIAKVGKKVLLVDLDLRRPRIHKSFGVERTPGMTEVLNGKCAFDAAVVQTSVENLWLLPGGETCDAAAELLQSADMPALFSDAMKKYDYIIIDTSPVLRTADASILATPDFCSVVLVASVNRTPKPLVRYALDMLGKAHVLGVVMNNIELNKISSLYYSYQYPNYAYYAYAYAYGYDYDYFYAEGRRQKKRPGRRHLMETLRSAGRQIRRTFLPME